MNPSGHDPYSDIMNANKYYIEKQIADYLGYVEDSINGIGKQFNIKALQT